MNSIIIRKPKFMRNDAVMWLNLKVAAIIAEQAARPELTTEQQYELLAKISKPLNNAAKAGGFFSVKDFNKWLARQKHTT